MFNGMGRVSQVINKRNVIVEMWEQDEDGFYKRQHTTKNPVIRKTFRLKENKGHHFSFGGKSRSDVEDDDNDY
jgi:hypothetical protein